MKKKKSQKIENKYKEWAMYKGEEFLGIGNFYELEEQTGTGMETLKWMATPSGQKRANAGKKRRLLVLVEDDED